MSRELTGAEQAMLNALAGEAPDALRASVDKLVPPKNLASAGASITTTGAVSSTAVAIPASYEVGKRYDLGVYLGQFDLGKGVGEKPIFVVELTQPMTFNQTVVATGMAANGYVADPDDYDAKQGLREGKTSIATLDMAMAAYANKNKGELKNMFKGAGWVLTSSPRPPFPYYVRVVDFRDGGVVWGTKADYRAPSLVVRTALTL